VIFVCLLDTLQRAACQRAMVHINDQTVNDDANNPFGGPTLPAPLRGRRTSMMTDNVKGHLLIAILQGHRQVPMVRDVK